ncbi:hypothetical protein [Williamsoniiplasma lucivorax]|uniref:Transmembrane protein n=1 Tax=Williamsoniiplasma lucivorax TaxID=209274 RepID=A0A2S5RCR8_9MOLU|nr:hypothetical protein [Williamsoniiplasma lucivorax]PPE05129.1 hypothetical protein ELUCI_v1c06650 [Williamsoniiplasma lucivorax]
MQNNSKSYTRLKYLATFAATLLIGAFVFVVIAIFKTSISWKVIISVDISLWFIGFVALFIYFFFRFKLMAKTNYERSQKDLLKWYLAITFYSLALIFGLINLLVMFANDKILSTDLKIIVLVFGGVMFLFLVTASILEAASRIDEHIFMNVEEHKLIQQEKQQNKNTKISDEEILVKVQKQRTSDAETFLKKSQDNPFMNQNNQKENE